MWAILSKAMPKTKEAIKVYKSLQVEHPEAAKKMLAEFMKNDAITKAGKQRDKVRIRVIFYLKINV